MIMQVLSHTPLWVWGMLAALLALGLSQTRQRHVAPLRLLLLPLALLGLGLSSVSAAFVTVPATAALWLLAAAAGAALAFSRPPGAGTRWLAEERRLQIPGSWVPLAMIVVIFALRYAANVGLALNPGWRSAPAALLPLALLYGGLSGLFLGRALALLRLTRAPLAMRLDVGAV